MDSEEEETRMHNYFAKFTLPCASCLFFITPALEELHLSKISEHNFSKGHSYMLDT